MKEMFSAAVLKTRADSGSMNEVGVWVTVLQKLWMGSCRRHRRKRRYLNVLGLVATCGSCTGLSHSVVLSLRPAEPWPALFDTSDSARLRCCGKRQN